jgi:hypothetical protein
MKSSGEELDIIAAYREVGTYRGAAAMCGTTHKTVKRVVERALSGGTRPGRKPRERNYDSVADLVAKRVAATKRRISEKRLLPPARAAGYVPQTEGEPAPSVEFDGRSTSVSQRFSNLFS